MELMPADHSCHTRTALLAMSGTLVHIFPFGHQAGLFSAACRREAPSSASLNFCKIRFHVCGK
jgi:hypothetical protein